MARGDRDDMGSLLEKGDGAWSLVTKTGVGNDAYLPTSTAGDLEQPLLRRKPSDWKAPFVILAFECLESTAFFGVATNLVMFLTSVLGETNSESATNAAVFSGTSYLTPLLGAFIADSFLGSYKTTFISAIIYFLGILTITLSALIPSVTPSAPAAAAAVSGGVPLPSAATAQNLVFYGGLYLVALGSGGIKSALLPLGAEQFDDDNPADAERKGAFFSWFYICLTIGMLTSGTLIVWIQDNVSWVLGFGVSAACIAVGLIGFLIATPLFKKRTPTGSPLKSVAQVLVASCRKMGVKVPSDATLLYEKSSSDDAEYQQQDAAAAAEYARLAHTSDFKFLDKAAVVEEEEGILVVSSKKVSPDPWRLCTVTQVEELKALIRMVPTWLTSVVYSVAYCQMMTTVIEQGATMDPKVFGLFNVPAASLPAVEVVFVVFWTLFYDRVVSPAAGRYTGNPRGLSLFQRMGAGRFLMILAMAAVAIIETVRLDAVHTGRQPISMLWQLPAYFLIGGSEALNFIGQLEFFFDQSPDSMKGMGTAIYLLSISAGNYLSSFLVSAVQTFTVGEGSPGWIPDDLNKGHLDYFFWGLAAICAFNFVAHIACSKAYTLKKAM